MGIPKLKQNKKATPEEIYENGRKFGQYQIKKKLRIKMLNLAFDFFRDELAYEPYKKRIEELFAKE